MSKFIKIPSYQNPCEIIINGVKYQYPAGQTCLVPDEVAMVIENVINNAPKYVKETVRRPDIVETVSGEVISVSDSTEAPLQGLLGKTGVTQTELKPFGTAEIDSKVVDVCSTGDFIDRGTKVQVVQITGKTVTVKVYTE